MSRPATTDREGMQRIREALARVEQQLAYISRERAPGLTTQVPGLDIAIVKADEDIAGIEEPEGESDNDFEVHTGECTVYRLLSDGSDKVLREKSWKLEGRHALHNVGKTAISDGDVLIALGDADTGWWIGAAVGGGTDGFAVAKTTTTITAATEDGGTITVGSGSAEIWQEEDGDLVNTEQSVTVLNKEVGHSVPSGEFIVIGQDEQEDWWLIPQVEATPSTVRIARTTTDETLCSVYPSYPADTYAVELMDFSLESESPSCGIEATEEDGSGEKVLAHDKLRRWWPEGSIVWVVERDGEWWFAEEQPWHWIRNDTGEGRLRFDAVAADVPIVTSFPGASDDTPDNMGRIPFVGGSPSSDAHASNAAILLESPSSGAFSGAVIDGVVTALINIDNENHFLAHVHVGEHRLRTKWYGNAEILWKESGTGLKWAVVRLGMFQAPVLDGFVRGQSGIGKGFSGDVEIEINGALTGDIVEAHYSKITVVDLLDDDMRVAVQFNRQEGRFNIVDHECPDEENGE